MLTFNGSSSLAAHQTASADLVNKCVCLTRSPSIVNLFYKCIGHTTLQDGVPAWILKMLLKYPIAEQVKKARAKTLSKIPHITMQRVQQLTANAKCSVASVNDAVSAQLINATAKLIFCISRTPLLRKKYDGQPMHCARS